MDKITAKEIRGLSLTRDNPDSRGPLPIDTFACFVQSVQNGPKERRMQNISANEAKSHFGQLLDTARQEPVTIEKHGRPVAVILSTEDYNELEQIRIEHLRAEVKAGMDPLDRGESVELDEFGLGKLFEDIKGEGRNNITE